MGIGPKKTPTGRPSGNSHDRRKALRRKLGLKDKRKAELFEFKNVRFQWMDSDGIIHGEEK